MGTVSLGGAALGARSVVDAPRVNAGVRTLAISKLFRQRAVPASRAVSFLSEVESLRGIAILMVMLNHAAGVAFPGIGTGGWDVSRPAAIIGAGNSGVSLFFVLSAFCLSLPVFARNGAVFSSAGFFRRRALRILPLYWTAVLAGIVSSASTPRAVADAIPYLFFANGVSAVAPLKPFSEVWWSLATEAQFYLLFPLLPLALRSRATRRAVAVGLGLYGAWYGCFQAGWFPVFTVRVDIAITHSLLGLGHAFLAGMLSAWLYVRHGETLRTRLAASRLFRNGGGDALLALELVAIGSLLQWVMWSGYWQSEARGVQWWHVAEGLCWSALLLTLLVAPARMKGLLSNRPLGRIGLWSYSLYLVHLPVQYVFVKYCSLIAPSMRTSRPGLYLTLTLALATSIMVSTQTYRWIEKPFLERKNRVRQERTAASMVAAVTA